MSTCFARAVTAITVKTTVSLGFIDNENTSEKGTLSFIIKHI